MNEQPPILASVCIPTRNEATNLPDCLHALGGAFGEIVVIDSGSTDGTPEIAAKAGAHVIDFKWNGRVPKKRNWALEHHSFKHEWVLFLDADERVTPEFLGELRAKLPTSPHVGYWLSFTNWFMGRPLRYGDTFRKLALFRRDAGRYEHLDETWWSQLDMEVHEHPVLKGSIGAIEARLDHRDDRGLEHYLAKHNAYSTWEANRYAALHRSGPEAWAALTARQKVKYRYLDRWWLSYVYFLASYAGKRGFLDGWEGWTLARLKLRYFDEIRLKILEARRLARPRRSA